MQRMLKPIPSQQEHNPGNPEEHFTWALRNMPTYAGVGMVTHSGFLRLWSKHLWQCGFAHRDYLASLADEDGNIHVSKLPAQTIKFQEPFRGPHHQYNNAGRWVPVSTPDPEPMHIPDIRDLTTQENQAMIEQYRRAGWLDNVTAAPPGAVAKEAEEYRGEGWPTP